MSDITFSNIHGTCSGDKTIVVDCAKIGCDDINLKQIKITLVDPNKPSKTICNIVKGLHCVQT